VDDPARAVQRAVAAGARETSAVQDEHGWRLGRIVDPFGRPARLPPRSPAT
jgi:PhnB protein